MQKKSLSLFLTFRAYAKEIKPVGLYFVACFPSHFPAEFIKRCKFRVPYLFTLCTNDMGVGVWPVAVVAVVAVMKAQLQHLIQVLEKGDGFTNSREACGRL